MENHPGNVISVDDDTFVHILPVPYDPDLVLFVTQRGRFILYSKSIGGRYLVMDKRHLVNTMATDWRKARRDNVLDVDPDNIVPGQGYPRGLAKRFDMRGFMSAAFDISNGRRPKRLYVTRSMDMAEYHNDAFYDFHGNYDTRFDHYLVLESYDLVYDKKVEFRHREWGDAVEAISEGMMTVDTKVPPKRWLYVPHPNRLITGMEIMVDVGATAKDPERTILLVAISDGGPTLNKRGDLVPTTTAQNYTDFRGKVLRIDVTEYNEGDTHEDSLFYGRTPYGHIMRYSVPDDNPYTDKMDMRRIKRAMRELGELHGSQATRPGGWINSIREDILEIRSEIWVAGVNLCSAMDTHPVVHEQIAANRDLDAKTNSPTAKLGLPIETIIAVGHRGNTKREGLFVLRGGENLGWPYRENGRIISNSQWEIVVKRLSGDRIRVPTPLWHYKHTSERGVGGIVTGSFYSDGDSYICGDMSYFQNSRKESERPYNGATMITRLTEFDFRNDNKIIQENLSLITSRFFVSCIGRSSNATDIYIGFCDTMDPKGKSAIRYLDHPDARFGLQCQSATAVTEEEERMERREEMEGNDQDQNIPF